MHKQSGNKPFLPLLTGSFTVGCLGYAGFIILSHIVAQFYGNAPSMYLYLFALILTGITLGIFIGIFLPVKAQKNTFSLHLLFVIASLIIALPSIAIKIQFATFDKSFLQSFFLTLMGTFFPISLLIGIYISTAIKYFALFNSIKNVNNVVPYCFLGSFLSCLIFITFARDWTNDTVSYVVVGLTLGYLGLYIFLNKKLQHALLLLPYCILCFLLINILTFKPNSAKELVKVVYRSSQLFEKTEIAEQPDAGSRTLLQNSVSTTLFHIASAKSIFGYIPRIATYLSYKPIGSKILIGGLRGGLLANQLTSNGFDVEVCDPLPNAKYVATTFFDFQEQINVLEMDIRQNIHATQIKYDIVILDFVFGELQPAHLYSIDFFNQIKAILQKDGVLVVHFEGMLAGKDGIAAKSIWKTLDAAKFNVQLLRAGQKYFMPSELLFFASAEQLDLSRKKFRLDTYLSSFNFPTTGNFFIDDVDWSEGQILSDDKPVLDFLQKNIMAEKRKVSKQYLYFMLNQGTELF